ncbi:MAG: VWA domain-containing protein [Gammaproteobacteria bacterium]|nr:VWA domain-containing protein [Gammaproteobacteria bacterium]NIN37224.1 VWA domain-containing protein [Gammaproteobacteria bacterium]NIO26082.1 VWA domain-containing protein [Gammaproteobacteria bacterium]NIO66695.1 VWA domain-containing protein [Gammaproteobacteria bacterium]NIP46372.1 VWA domain-containing protein [Gammaproteobacteria bacterium]
MKRRKPPLEVFSMSFLDIISCAFGAIILLFVLSKQAEPMVIEGIRENLDGLIANLQRTIYELRGEVRVLNREKNAGRIALERERTELAGLRRELEAVRGEFAAAEQTLEAKLVIEGKLATARQELSEEMRRLLGERYRRPDADPTIGGVPVDSEYIIFIIDTSDSMFGNARALYIRKISEILKIYPKVKGIQVMNDMGRYMYSAYAGRWIPDTPARRKSILKQLRNWNPFSNSSPVEGITEAIRTFYAPDKKISLYVFGDDFQRGSAEVVVKQIDAINKEDAQGNRLVRIHAVGFPVLVDAGASEQASAERFASLMRILSEKNGGTFVALDRFKP